MIVPTSDKEYIKRLESKRIIDSHGCWLYQGQKNYKGYGYISYQGKLMSVHKLSLKLYRPNDPLQHLPYVLHNCDTRDCFNPDHLFYGTPKQNTDDMMAKGRGLGQFTKQETCNRGHLWTPENTLTYSTTGRRVCRACKTFTRLTRGVK